MCQAPCWAQPANVTRSVIIQCVLHRKPTMGLSTGNDFLAISPWTELRCTPVCLLPRPAGLRKDRGLRSSCRRCTGGGFSLRPAAARGPPGLSQVSPPQSQHLLLVARSWSARGRQRGIRKTQSPPQATGPDSLSGLDILAPSDPPPLEYIRLLFSTGTRAGANFLFQP